jgi:hypothetical protein
VGSTTQPLGVSALGAARLPRAPRQSELSKRCGAAGLGRRSANQSTPCTAGADEEIPIFMRESRRVVGAPGVEPGASTVSG